MVPEPSSPRPESPGAPGPASDSTQAEDTASPADTASSTVTAPADGSASADSADTADGRKEPPQSWDDLKPWKGVAAPTDKFLLFAIFAVPAFYLGMMPFRPFLIANQPILLEFLTGAKTAIVGAAAYARVGEFPLWLVLVAGFVGMTKFDWLFWLAGRRWGDGILNIFTSTDRQRRQVEKFRRMPPWLLFLLVVISRVPGIPGTLVWLVAGWSGMRLWVFLIADFLACLILTVGVALLGYSLGQAAVDVIQTIDRYALWISLGLVVLIAVWSGAKANKQAKDAQT